MYFVFIGFAFALSYKCNYDEIEGPVWSSVLYKEDNLAEVKWIEINEYCRAKGDTTVYSDAGKGKCEYSRDICKWSSSSCIVNEQRENDSLEECQSLLRDNILVNGLDRGRNIPKQYDESCNYYDDCDGYMTCINNKCIEVETKDEQNLKC